MNKHYSIQLSGTGARLLRHHPWEPTQSVTSLKDPETARQVASVLDEEKSYGLGGDDRFEQHALAKDAERCGTKPSGSRRRMLNAFDAGVSGNALDPEGWHSATFGQRLGSLLCGQPATVVRAVRDEAADLYADLDDVLVVLRVAGSPWGVQPTGQVVVNDFLASATPAQLAELADPGSGDPGTLYELIGVYEEELTSVLEGQAPDELTAEINREQLAAWLAHRPSAT